MHRKSASAGCAATLLIFTSMLPAQAFGQVATITADQGAGNCQFFNAPIARMEGGVVPHSRIESCSNGIADVTAAPSSLHAGEITVMAFGRYLNKQLPYMIRGRPNTAYSFHPVYLSQLSGRYIYDPALYPLSSVAHALPFQPTQIVDLGNLGNGQTGYGYRGLTILPGRARDAYPLNSNSVVIAIDGFNFVSPAALTSYLATTASNETTIRYVEVVYLQSGDARQALHRALIPLYPRSKLEPSWSQIAATNTMFQSSQSWVGRNKAIIALAMAGGLAGLIYAFDQSSMGREMKRDHDECLERTNGNALECM